MCKSGLIPQPNIIMYPPVGRFSIIVTYKCDLTLKDTVGILLFDTLFTADLLVNFTNKVQLCSTLPIYFCLHFNTSFILQSNLTL